MNPAIEQLRRLCRFGFTGERLFNQDNHLELVHYTRHFRGVREVVLVYSERKALAYRTRDRLDVESPLDVAENAIEWRLHGDVVTVATRCCRCPRPGRCPILSFPIRSRLVAGRAAPHRVRLLAASRTHGIPRDCPRARSAVDQRRRCRQSAV